jgi:hypothetical protein
MKVKSVLKKIFLLITVFFWSLIICTADSLWEPFIKIINEDGSIYWQMDYYWVPLVGFILDYLIFSLFYTSEDFK